MNRYKKFWKDADFFIVGLVLMGLVGCATTSGALEQNNIGHEKFYDSCGDYKLVGRNNDIYLEKLDGSENRRITNTPDIKEEGVFFKDSNIIAYYHESGPAIRKRMNFFIVSIGKGDISEKEISMEEYDQFWNSRV